MKYFIIKFLKFIKRVVFRIILFLKKGNSATNHFANIFSVLFPKFDYQIFAFENLYNYTSSHSNKSIILDNRSLSLTYCPPAFNQPRPVLMSKSERPGFKQYVALLNEVEVIGGSNLILLDNMKALYDIKYFDIHNKILYSDQGIRFYHKEHLLIKKLHSTITYDVGIFLGGNFSWNYYHFLYEILVKFERISTMELDQSIPIFVDKICLEVPQYLELLSMLNTENRKLIPIEKCVRYKVKQLYYISCPNIIPPDLLNPSDLNPDDVLFDLNILDFLRLKMLPHSSNTSFPKRFYISRKNASNRRQFNENEVFNVLKRYGFQSVLPENYSIADQISLFNNAEFIAGGAGAALTNLLFCSKSCKVIAFSKNPVQFSGFSTIAKHVGAEMLTYTENISNSDNLQDLHESFLIDTERLDLLLSEWINT